jgi:uncharacterized protein (TIGR00255 family)
MKGKIMKSMTGFGKAIYFDENIELEIEIKSLNNRFFDIRQKLPVEFYELENQIADSIKKKIQRGKVEVKINFNQNLSKQVSINQDKLIQFKQLLNKIMTKIDSPIQIPLDYLVSELQDNKNDEKIIELYQNTVFETLEKALEKHQETAFREGSAMKQDMLKSMQCLQAALDEIQAMYPAHKEKTFAMMRQNIEQLIGNKIPAERMKDIALEAAVYYEKSDVNEELKRFYSHLKEFLKTCENRAENIGKRLQFILQEMQREINTIGSKFCTEESFKHILICKEEIEKCREMIQNVE